MIPRLFKAIFLGFLIGIVGLLISPFRFALDIEENAGLALLFKLRGVRPAPSEVVVVSIDKESSENLNLPDNSFDVVVSLCALEHFGLGRYGDEFDLDADKKAFSEMIRVLKPNGRLIFTTPISRSQPSIAFNAHRIYNYEMLRTLCANLICEEEKVYSNRLGGSCSLEEVTTEPKQWDVYCGCWKK